MQAGAAFREFLLNKLDKADPVAATAGFLSGLLDRDEEEEGLQLPHVPLTKGGLPTAAARVGLQVGDATMMHLANTHMLTKIFTPDEAYRDSTALAYARNVANSHKPVRAKKHSIPKTKKPTRIPGL